MDNVIENKLMCMRFILIHHIRVDKINIRHEVQKVENVFFQSIYNFKTLNLHENLFSIWRLETECENYEEAGLAHCFQTTNVLMN